MHNINSSLVAGQSRFTDNPRSWKYSTEKNSKVLFYSLCCHDLSSCYSKVLQRCNVISDRVCVAGRNREGERNCLNHWVTTETKPQKCQVQVAYGSLNLGSQIEFLSFKSWSLLMLTTPRRHLCFMGAKVKYFLMAFLGVWVYTVLTISSKKIHRFL